MENLAFAVAVVVLALGGLLGLAYSLDARRARHGPIGPQLPPPGPIGRVCWWCARVLAAVMLAAVVLAGLLHLPPLAWLALGCAALFFIDHVIYRIIRLTGK